MKSQCEGSLHPVEAAPGSRFACPWCGKPTPVTKSALLRTHSINGGWMGGPSYQRGDHPKPTARPVERTSMVVRSRYFEGVHYVLTTQKSPTRLNWTCKTCGHAGVVTRGFEGQDLRAKARTNHYQRARRAAKHP